MYALFLTLPFLISFFATPFVSRAARYLSICDAPVPPRKNHPRPTPLLGGVAVFLAFLLSVFVIGLSSPLALGALIGMCVLLTGGVLDDSVRLPPSRQVIFPILASLIAIALGVGQDNITNPLYYLGIGSDPLIHLKAFSIPIFGGEITLFTDLFTFLWLMILMYATKLLDGLNGLVSGIAVIGGAILFITSLVSGQSLPAALSLILAGSYLGFLPHNLAGKIFLGESGSTIAGFLLGVLSLIGTAKISITLLVLGLPILDLLWVMYERRFRAKISPFIGDARHLHFKLVRSGLSPRRAVILLWGVSLIFGVLGLVLQGITHGALLIGLIALMGTLLFMTHRKDTL